MSSRPVLGVSFSVLICYKGYLVVPVREDKRREVRAPFFYSYNRMNQTKILIVTLLAACLTSCSSSSLVTHSVAYQSVRPVNYKPEVPLEAKIICAYSITDNGEIVVAVKNNTDDIMIIDQTKSFLVNSDGTSESYYDPTVRVTSNTRSNSETRGGSLNLGAVTGALGIGGIIGTLASGINLGRADTEGFSSTNTTYFSDLPQISLGPNGKGFMSKNFPVKYLGKSFLANSSERNNAFTNSDSYCKFSVCISYSLDGGNTFDKIVTDFYANSWIVCPVRSHGKVNDALRNVMSSKTDCLNESWWLLYFNDNMGYSNSMFNGAILDYK